jgi:hypothetical protein
MPHTTKTLNRVWSPGPGPVTCWRPWPRASGTNWGSLAEEARIVINFNTVKYFRSGTTLGDYREKEPSLNTSAPMRSQQMMRQLDHQFSKLEDKHRSFM